MGVGKLLEKGGVGKLHGSAGWLGGGVLTVHVRGTGLCGVLQRGVVGALACVLFKFLIGEFIIWVNVVTNCTIQKTIQQY